MIIMTRFKTLHNCNSSERVPILLSSDIRKIRLMFCAGDKEDSECIYFEPSFLYPSQAPLNFFVVFVAILHYANITRGFSF